MTDNLIDSTLPEKETAAPTPAPAAAPAATLAPAPATGPGKAIWMGTAAVGIGSAALVAALMYATRSRRKK